jgi:hypothetical protein
MKACVTVSGPTWRIYDCLFSNRSATADQGWAIFRQFIHNTKNKKILLAETLKNPEGIGERKWRDLAKMATYR